MSHFKRFGNLLPNLQCLLNRQCSPLQPLGQGLPLNELKHERLASNRLLNAINPGDVAMVERGQELLFAIAFYPLATVLFGRKGGWLVMWTVLVTVGILSTFGPSPGSLEGMIYTIFPIPLQLFGLTEVLAQSLLLSVILCYWVNHPENRWMNWLLGVSFFLVMLLPAMGLLTGPSQ